MYNFQLVPYVTFADIGEKDVFYHYILQLPLGIDAVRKNQEKQKK